MHIVILAGGGGTRLWPLSRQEFPKQFLHFGDHLSLLQKCVGRFSKFALAKSISVVTNAQYEPLVRGQLEKIDASVHLIVEPCSKNTAPAIAFAVKVLQERLGVGEEESVLVLPSDHFIEPEEVFLAHLEKISSLNGLVLFGIKPTKPETGYGYIQVGKRRDESIYEVKRFVEKPDRNRAQMYVNSGEYYWNMGMCAFSIELFSQMLQKHAPHIAALLQGSLEEAIGRFAEMPNISFDYAVLEKCEGALICPLPVQWSDVGCWDSVYEILEKDEHQNAIIGNVFPLDTKNSLIIGGKKLISTIGLEDAIIVETEDAIFITKKGESQKVRDLVQKLIQFGKIPS